MELRHSRRERPFELVGGNEETEAAVVGHITAHLGPVESVYHEFLSDLVHIDVHVVRRADCQTLVTCGMSDRAMTVPDEYESPGFAELLLHLPADWPLELSDERHAWPLRWLKALAKLPHEYESWLDIWHTIPNGDPPEPFADDTALCAMMLTPPVLAPEEFALLTTESGKEIAFYEVLPLHADELALKLAEGTDALIDRLDAAGVRPVVEPGRPSCV